MILSIKCKLIVTEFILKLEVSFNQSVEDKFLNGQKKKGVGLFLRDKATFYLKSGES